MTSTELTETEPKAGTLALRGDQVEWSEVQRAALAHIGIAEAPQADQQVLMHVAQRTGLDPFARQIYMIPRQEGSGDNRKTKWTIQTGIDGFRLIAERHPAYRGQVGPQWCGEDGVWRDVWLDREKPPAAARVGILRDDREGPVWGTAMFTEYAQTKTWNGQVSLTAMWRQKGAHMIAKCAEALAYRKAFPLELGGLHTDDEMAAADNPGRADRAPAPARPAAVTTDELTGQALAPSAPPTPEQEDDVVDAELVDDTPPADPTTDTGPPVDEEPLAGQRQNRRMHALFREAEVTDRKDRLYLTGLLLNRQLDTSKGLTAADADAVIDALQALKDRGDDEGLVGAVNNLMNEAYVRESEARDADAATEDQAVADEAAGEQK